MEEAELLVSRQGGVGRIRLNRPRALNSLTLDMVRLFTQALRAFGRDPEIVAVLVTGEGDRGLCAGGDIRALYDGRHGDRNHYRTFWREEYELNALIAAFAKPYVVLMDGLVMGGGVGISAHGNCRVVTERTRLAMPETGIGFIPDVGGTWLLSRAGGLGAYMAFSGAMVSGADAIAAGLADFSVSSDQTQALIARLQRIQSARQAQDIVHEFHYELEAGELAPHKAMLDEAMTGASVEEILARLSQQGSGMALAAASRIAGNSPTSLKVTYALLSAAKGANLHACLVREFRAGCSLLASHDLYEGIRAAIIDKDRTPRWRPPTLAEVTEASVTRILEGDGSPEPSFFDDA
jgi:enoyl-CoA hydratase